MTPTTCFLIGFLLGSLVAYLIAKITFLEVEEDGN